MFEKLKEKRAKSGSRIRRYIKDRRGIASPSRVVHEAFVSGDLETLSMIFGGKTLDANNQAENDVESHAMQEDAG